MLTAVLEDETGPRDEVLHGRGDEDLRGARHPTDPRPDVHGDAADLPVDRLDATISTSVGPSPVTWYAMCTPSVVLAYRMSGTSTGLSSSAPVALGKLTE